MNLDAFSKEFSKSFLNLGHIASLVLLCIWNFYNLNDKNDSSE